MTDEINTHNMVVDFGKHKGELWTRLPISYLKWLVNETDNYKELAQAELDRRGVILEPEMELSGHAIDRASIYCLGWWEHSRLSKNEGIHAWLYRVASEALEKGEKEDGKVYYNGLKFIFKFGAVFPILKTIMPTKHKRK